MADGTISHSFSEEDIKRIQRTPKGRTYDEYRAKLYARMASDKEFAAQRTQAMHQMRAVSPSQVHSNAFMDNLSKQYANDDYIGEQVMPVAPVAKLSNVFPTYDKRERLAGPDDAMGHRSEANELDETRGSDSYTLVPYGLQNSIAAATIKNEDPAFDEMLDLTESILDVLALKREIRIATVVTTAANYSGNTRTLSGADQWDSVAGGNPIKDLQDALAATWHGAGAGDLVGVCSLDVWNALARHPLVIDFFKYTMPGLTKMDRLAQEIGLTKIIVGAARKDTANITQTAAYSRIWGKDFAILRVARRPTLRNASFGYTLRRVGDPTTQTWFDPKAGIDGAYWAKVGSYEQHKVIAGDAGYLLKAVIA